MLSDSIVVEPQSVDVSSAPQEVVLKVQADADWGVSAVDPWLKLSQTGGGKGETEIKVSIEENNAEEQREAVLLFRTTSQKVEVPVTQHYKVVAVEIKDQTLLKALLKLLDKDGDGILSTKEISGVTELNLSDCGLADAAELVGLFPDLVSLDLSGNKLESLDIRLMPKLENLNASNNPSLSIIYVWSDFVAPEGFKVPEGVEYVEPEIYTPAGYQLVWRDEFNDPSLIMPDTKEWWYETAEPGWVNNELQTYVAGRTGDIITADVSDGTLKIRAIKSGKRCRGSGICAAGVGLEGSDFGGGCVSGHQPYQ